MHRGWFIAAVGVCGSAPLARAASAPLQDAATAQDEAEHDVVELRITQVRGASVVVDRGSADLVRVGDRVFFRPREGGLHGGVVARVDERTAVVDLQGGGFPAEPGVRGFVRIPASRSAPAAEARRKPRAAPTGDKPRSSWSNQDEEYEKGQPLLARVRPLRPDERPASFSGRWYTTLDQIRSTEDDRSDAFYRMGGALRVDNLTGRGDRLSFDGELNYRDTDVPDNDDQNARRARLDRLSYSWGGTRFEAQRFEVGRFLHYGMPEFGVLDGAEWSTRTDSGDRFGVALGFLPEPDLNYETGSDFALSAFYRWVYDASEQLSASAGFQKSWHHTDADRDLAVVNLNYLPDNGWSFFSSTWVDIYTDGDNLKDPGPELTQALANLTHSWSSTSAVGVRVSHVAFPQINRREFVAPQPLDFADAHVDRIAAFARTALTSTWRLRVEAGMWSDEEDSGGDVEIGQEFDHFLFDGAVVGVSAFAVNGQFNDSIGARSYLRSWDAHGGWSLEYELANNDLVGFTSQNDDLPQHRARAQWDWLPKSAWTLRLHLDLQLWDSESSLIAGLHINRSF